MGLVIGLGIWAVLATVVAACCWARAWDLECRYKEVEKEWDDERTALAKASIRLKEANDTIEQLRADFIDWGIRNGLLEARLAEVREQIMTLDELAQRPVVESPVKETKGCDCYCDCTMPGTVEVTIE